MLDDGLRRTFRELCRQAQPVACAVHSGMCVLRVLDVARPSRAECHASSAHVQSHFLLPPSLASATAVRAWRFGALGAGARTGTGAGWSPQGRAAPGKGRAARAPGRQMSAFWGGAAERGVRRAPSRGTQAWEQKAR